MRELDADQLRARADALASACWPGAQLSSLQPLPGGISSLTFASALHRPGHGPRPVVVKVAPPGLAPVHNRDVLRQARILRALQGRPGVPVPEVLLSQDGDPPFFVMELVAGQAYEPHKDLAAEPPAPAVVAPRVRAAARALAALHALDPRGIGVRDPVTGVEEELARWARLFATAGDDLRHDEAKVRDALAAAAPRPGAPAVLHGDYRLGNLQFTGTRLAAIIDWEIWSVGDARHDVAWLMVWCDPVQRFLARRDGANQAAADAMPAGERVRAEYEAARGRRQADLPWFLALCHYKRAATIAVLAKRNRRLPDPDPALELAAASAPAVLARARELLG